MKLSLALEAGAAGVLAVLLALEWLPASSPPVSLPAPSHVHGSRSDPESVARDTADWSAAIIKRPLFAIGRKPPKTAKTGHTAAPTGLPRLSGIMITQAGRRAIFMPETGKPLTLAEGGSLDDYTIRHIRADQVLLTGPKGDMVLRPVYDAAQTGTVTTPGVQPGFNPGFPRPGFNPGFNPGFSPGGLPLGFQPPQPPPQSGSQDSDDSDSTPTPPPQGVPSILPGLHGPFIPRGRN